MNTVRRNRTLAGELSYLLELGRGVNAEVTLTPIRRGSDRVQAQFVPREGICLTGVGKTATGAVKALRDALDAYIEEKS